VLIVDSSVWIDALRGASTREAKWLNDALGRQTIGMTSLNLCEVLQGVDSDAQFHGMQRKLLKFPIFNTGSQELAIASAWNYRRLRNLGVTVRKTVDCLIATYCIEQRFSLLHNDRDFDPFEAHLGLQVFRP